MQICGFDKGASVCMSQRGQGSVADLIDIRIKRQLILETIGMRKLM